MVMTFLQIDASSNCLTKKSFPFISRFIKVVFFIGPYAKGCYLGGGGNRLDWHSYTIVVEALRVYHNTFGLNAPFLHMVVLALSYKYAVLASFVSFDSSALALAFDSSAFDLLAFDSSASGTSDIQMVAAPCQTRVASPILNVVALDACANDDAAYNDALDVLL